MQNNVRFINISKQVETFDGFCLIVRQAQRNYCILSYILGRTINKLKLFYKVKSITILEHKCLPKQAVSTSFYQLKTLRLFLIKDINKINIKR